jgi:hypothetical protein
VATGPLEFGASGSFALPDGQNMSWMRLQPAKLWINETLCIPADPTGVYVVHEGLKITSFINGIGMIRLRFLILFSEILMVV